MTASEFISEIEEAWGKEISGKQAQIYCRKLERFGNWQLDDLLERVLETNKYMPRLSDIWTAAKELGLFKQAEREMRTTSEHSWTTNSCQLCAGEGRLHVWYLVYSQDGQWRRKLRRIFGYCSDAGKHYKPEEGEQAFLYRCSCASGEAATLPENWPQWNRQEQTA